MENSKEKKNQRKSFGIFFFKIECAYFFGSKEIEKCKNKGNQQD